MSLVTVKVLESVMLNFDLSLSSPRGHLRIQVGVLDAVVSNKPCFRAE